MLSPTPPFDFFISSPVTRGPIWYVHLHTTYWKISPNITVTFMTQIKLSWYWVIHPHQKSWQDLHLVKINKKYQSQPPPLPTLRTFCMWKLKSMIGLVAAFAFCKRDLTAQTSTLPAHAFTNSSLWFLDFEIAYIKYPLNAGLYFDWYCDVC